MAALRQLTRNVILNNLRSELRPKINIGCVVFVCNRFLNYSPVVYDGEKNPAPLFFNKEVQSLLKSLTRIDLAKVYRRRKLGEKKLEDPEYKFMTDEQLTEALKEAQQKADEMLQIPPAVSVRSDMCRVFSKDPELQGLETSRLVFTDITFGVKDSNRLIVVREPDGTLQEAEWKLRNRINQLYFPKKGRSIKPPRIFEERYLENLLKKEEYVFILDSACVQLEPDDHDYQRVVSITYQHVNDNNGFELLRSTRHFGALAFFLVWNKSIENLLLDLIETAHIEEAGNLMDLYSKVHNVSLTKDDNLKAIEEYIDKYCSKKGALELALQAYKDLVKQREELEEGIKTAHGFN